MNTLKFALAAAVVAAASTTAFANGLTDKDPQFVNTQALTNTYTPSPYAQAQGSGNTTQR